MCKAARSASAVLAAVGPSVGIGARAGAGFANCVRAPPLGHPPACCLWPRSRHRPAAAKAVSLLSGVVPANRECRSATRLCYRCGDECVCLPNWVRRMHVAPCGEGVGRRLVVRCTCLSRNGERGGVLWLRTSLQGCVRMSKPVFWPQKTPPHSPSPCASLRIKNIPCPKARAVMAHGAGGEKAR